MQPSTTPFTVHDLERAASKIAHAIDRLADEQHNRNRLAAITARRRGFGLPTDLRLLSEEQPPRED